MLGLMELGELMRVKPQKVAVLTCFFLVLLVSLFSPIIKFQIFESVNAATSSFVDGFESGNISTYWSSSGDSEYTANVSSTAYVGSFSANLTTNGAKWKFAGLDTLVGTVETHVGAVYGISGYIYVANVTNISLELNGLMRNGTHFQQSTIHWINEYSTNKLGVLNGSGWYNFQTGIALQASTWTYMAYYVNFTTNHYINFTFGATTYNVSMYSVFSTVSTASAQYYTGVCVWSQQAKVCVGLFDNIVTEINFDGAPSVGSPSTTTSVETEVCIISCTLADDVALVLGILSTNATSAWVNNTAKSLSGLTYPFSDSVVLPSAGTVFGYKMFVSDSAGQWTTSSTYTFITTSSPSNRFFFERGVHIAFHSNADLIMGEDFTFNADTITYGNGSVNIGGAWLNSTCDMTLTAFTSDWINFTISSGTRPVVDRGSLPSSVWIGGISRYQGNGWTASGTQVTITETATEVALYFGTSQDVTPSPNPSTVYPMILFFAIFEGTPVKGVRIEVFKDLLFAGSFYTLESGYTEERNLPEGLYTYNAFYNGLILEGSFNLYSDDTINLLFNGGAGGNLSVRSTLLRGFIAVLIIACALAAIIKVKNR